MPLRIERNNTETEGCTMSDADEAEWETIGILWAAAGMKKQYEAELADSQKRAARLEQQLRDTRAQLAAAEQRAASATRRADNEEARADRESSYYEDLSLELTAVREERDRLAAELKTERTKASVAAALHTVTEGTCAGYYAVLGAFEAAHPGSPVLAERDALFWQGYEKRDPGRRMSQVLYGDGKKGKATATL
ncbi:hypothetical protein [Azospirillum himalayense]